MNEQKKELKKFINENGFFLHLDSVHEISRKEFLESNALKTNSKVPEGDNIIFFEGTASQNFEKGEVSRNEYKIDQKGWMVNSYMKNPQILLSHSPKEPTGKAVELSLDSKGMKVAYYVNLDWVDEVNARRIKGGAYSGLSTGHITHEYKYENKETGELLTPEEIEDKYGLDEWDLMFSDAWNFVVTKAELVEISMVTLPSNPEALTVQNSLQNFYKNLMNKKKNEIEEEKKEEDTKTDPETSEPEGEEKTQEEPENPEPENGGDSDEEKPEGEEVEPEEPENGEPEEDADEPAEISEENYIALDASIKEKKAELDRLEAIKNGVKPKTTAKKATQESNAEINSLKEQLKEANALIESLSELAIKNSKELKKVNEILDSIPESGRGLVLSNQFEGKAVKKPGLLDRLNTAIKG